jgi:hypothetical protein
MIETHYGVFGTTIIVQRRRDGDDASKKCIDI